jgi:hypothetical protein
VLACAATAVMVFHAVAPLTLVDDLEEMKTIACGPRPA